MTTQRVMAQTAQLFGSTAGSGTAKGKQTGGGFDLVIDNTMKTGFNITDRADGAGRKAVQSAAENQSKDKSDAAKADARQARENVQSSTKTDAQPAAQTERQTKTAQTAAGTDRTDTQNTGEIGTDVTTLEKISAMLNSVRDTVMDMLNLSTGELDKLLEEQGLVLADLLQPQNLQQLVLASHGESDILAALTDENLADTVNKLLQAVEAVKQEAGLGMSLEQIKSMLEDVVLQQESKEAVSRNEGTGDKAGVPLEADQDKTQKPISISREEGNISSVSEKEAGNLPAEARLSGTGDSSSQSQSELRGGKEQEPSAADPFEAFVNNLSKAASSSQVEVQGNMVRMTEIREIANQIIQRIRVTIQPEQASMEMQLNPEHLGRVNLSVQSKNGVMTAQFVVQNEISREAIESQLHTLRETLNQQGLKVEAIEVSIATNSFEQGNNDNFGEQAEAKPDRSNHRISLEDAMNMTEEPEDTVTGQDLSGVRGSQIDYTA